MARPREFDEQVVIDRARDCFWSQGVAATSINDLSDATGISVGSIYKAFGSKSGLHRATLESYLDIAITGVEASLTDGDSPVAAIEAWLAAAAEGAGADGPAKGCYAVTCAAELAESDEAIAERLRRHDLAMRRALAGAIGRAVDAGELHCDPERGADLLFTTLNGLQVEARKGITVERAASILDFALDVLR